MDDDEIAKRIGDLAEEERQLERSHTGEGLSAEGLERMQAVEVALDQLGPPTAAASAPVVDDAAHARLLVEEDGALAQLGYRRNGGRLILVHMEVPDDIGGRGIAGRLVRAAVEWAGRDGLTLVPWCPYARRWLEDRPDVADSVTIDWTPPTPTPSR